jgi:hypothetical protein
MCSVEKPKSLTKIIWCTVLEERHYEWLFCALWQWMIHNDGSRMLLAFVGLSCCEFSVDETCNKDGNNEAVTSMKTIMWWSVLSTNSRHMDCRSGGFYDGMLLVWMFGQGWDLLKKLRHKIMLITKKDCLILLTGCIWNNWGVEWILWGFTDSSNWFCIVLFMRKGIKTLNA